MTSNVVFVRAANPKTPVPRVPPLTSYEGAPDTLLASFRRKRALPYLQILAWVIALSLSYPVRYARAENPFGNVDGGQGAPPPPPPVGNVPEFPEDDEFGSENNFGFNPPPGFESSPPPTDAEPPPMAPGSPPSSPPPPSNGGSRGSFANKGAPTLTAPPKTTVAPDKKGLGKTKAAPKLADYLELDSSVKGLEVKNFDFVDKDIRDLVPLVSKWTGKNFIVDNKVRGKITIFGPGQVTLQEAYNAFLSALEANGFTTVQAGKFIRIIESAEARRAPVKTYSGDYAPNNDQFITRIVQLKYINADEVQREFRDLTTRQGKLFAYEPTNSIIITDTGSNIQRIKELLESLDVKNFETTLHVLRIKNSSAKAISDMLGEIYGETKQGASGARSFRRSSLERTRGGGVISKVIPDESTNSLIVLANQAGFTQLKALVGKLDVRVTDTGRIHVYYCEYAKAEDLAQTLASLSGGGGGGGSSRSKRSSAPSAPGAPPGSTPSSGPSGPVSAELDGGVKVTSDSSTNSLVITANATDFKTLKRVIKKLDIPRLQVFVETAILELNADKSNTLGVNAALGAPGSRAFAGGFIGDQSAILDFLRGSPGEGATIPAFVGPQFQGTVATSATTTATVDVTTFMGLLRLLTKETEASVLSTPQIIALDNEEAVFKVLDDVPVVNSFAVTTGGASPTAGTSGTERLKSGIEIKLKPQINAASRVIRLAIEQTVENFKASTDIPEVLQKSQKAKTSRITNTSVVVKDQDYIMLGGLMNDRITETVTKVPLLGDIPILGWLFKSRTVLNQKTNLVILLRPRIIGTTMASASLIDDRLKKRDEFIDKYGSGERHPEEVDEIKERVKQQESRGKTEKMFEYRNNDLDEEEPPSPGEGSEMDPKRRSGASPRSNTNATVGKDREPPGDAPLIESTPKDG